MSKLLVIGCGGVAGVAIAKCCQNSDVFTELCIAECCSALSGPDYYGCLPGMQG